MPRIKNTVTFVGIEFLIVIIDKNWESRILFGIDMNINFIYFVVASFIEYFGLRIF
jgi:hypothetical protein